MDVNLDQAIVDPQVYASMQRYHDLFTHLRRDAPVRWTQPEGYEPFWTVSAATRTSSRSSGRTRCSSTSRG
jgi:hypothetical protein